MAMFLITVVIGFGIGILSGMLGVGGGSVMVPTLRLGFGLNALEATATSLFTVIPTSIAGLIQHIRNGNCVFPIGIAAGLGGALTSPLGVQLASMSPGWLIMLGTGAVIVYSSSTMLRRGLALPKDGQQELPSQAQSAPTSEVKDAETATQETGLTTRDYIIKGGIIGLFTGVAAGFVGLGGGFMMVPLFLVVLKQPMKKASASSLLAIVILAIPGVARHLMLGNILVIPGIAMALGSIPGAFLGASFTKRIPERALRIFFGIFLMCVAVFLVINEFISAA